jgi:hypothetical protein
MREIRTSGSEGGGIESNRFSLPLLDRRRHEPCEALQGLAIAWKPRK